MIRFQKFLITLIFFPLFISGQCPSSEADFADGGTFSGPCSLEVGSVVNITGPVIWTGGVLDITGSNGSVYIKSGGSLTVQAGTININDGSNGTLNVEAGGSLTIDANATVNVADNIRIYGDANIYGSLLSEESRLELYAGGIATVYGGGGVMTTRGAGDNIIEGTLNIYGSMETSGDMEINGGAVNVYSGGELTIGDPVNPPINDNDLLVYNGGSFFVEEGATVDVEDDVVGGDDPPPYTASQATITINGDLSAGDDMQVFNTTPNSNLGGSGNITVQGSFSDDECADYEGDFCFCLGEGDLCNSLLPVELVYFKSSEKDNSILLSWTTQSETNNEFFTVYHSRTGEEFTSLVNISGAGTTSIPQHYQYEDSEAKPGINYYKLRQTDYDGTWSESEVIYHNKEDLDFNYSFYPNPLQKGQDLNVIVDGNNDADSVQLILSDVSGREIGVISAVKKSTAHYVATIDENVNESKLIFIRVEGRPDLITRLFLRGF